MQSIRNIRAKAMADIDSEIAAYENMRGELEAQHTGKWVLVHNRQVIGVFDTSDEAAVSAVRQFGAGPYLIRQIGAPPITLPASVMYRPVYGTDKVRI
jgi:hypothetical protein